MNPRDPLTYHWKHEQRELDNDPRDWFEGPPSKPEHWTWQWVCAFAGVAVVIIVWWTK